MKETVGGGNSDEGGCGARGEYAARFAAATARRCAALSGLGGGVLAARRNASGGGGSGGALAPLGRCAVVGSSGLLRVSPQGAAIDDYDTVVRLNAAPTLGFEARCVCEQHTALCWQRRRWPASASFPAGARERLPSGCSLLCALCDTAIRFETVCGLRRRPLLGPMLQQRPLCNIRRWWARAPTRGSSISRRVRRGHDASSMVAARPKRSRRGRCCSQWARPNSTLRLSPRPRHARA